MDNENIIINNNNNNRILSSLYLNPVSIHSPNNNNNITLKTKTSVCS